ncbi:MAG: phosphatase PAP2 family protein [Bacteriovorax sp.]
MKKYFSLLFIFFLIPISNLYATIGEDIIAPVTNSDAQKVLIIGASTTLIVSLFKNSFVKNIQQDLHEDQPLCCKITEPGNKYLQILPNVLYSFAFGLNYFLNDNEDSKRKALGMAKATLYSGLITEGLKHIVYEKRPNGVGNSSFPSGHTTSAFAFASFVASEHPWYVGVPAYVMASYVGFCRMHDNHHYLHDVLAGATIGMSYGVAMSMKSKEEVEKKSALIVTPTEDLKGAALKFSMQF